MSKYPGAGAPRPSRRSRNTPNITPDPASVLMIRIEADWPPVEQKVAAQLGADRQLFTFQPWESNVARVGSEMLQHIRQQLFRVMQKFVKDQAGIQLELPDMKSYKLELVELSWQDGQQVTLDTWQIRGLR